MKFPIPNLSYYNLSLKSQIKNTLLYWVIQKNLMEFPLQTSLSYILQTIVCTYTTTNLLWSPCIFHKANIVRFEDSRLISFLFLFYYLSFSYFPTLIFLYYLYLFSYFLNLVKKMIWYHDYDSNMTRCHSCHSHNIR